MARCNACGATFRVRDRLGDSATDSVPSAAQRSRSSRARQLVDKGIELDASGRPEEARAAWSEAIRLEPSWLIPRCNLAKSLLHNGHVSEAQKQIDEAVVAAAGDVAQDQTTAREQLALIQAAITTQATIPTVHVREKYDGVKIACQVANDYNSGGLFTNPSVNTTYRIEWVGITYPSTLGTQEIEVRCPVCGRSVKTFVHVSDHFERVWIARIVFGFAGLLVCLLPGAAAIIAAVQLPTDQAGTVRRAAMVLLGSGLIALYLFILVRMGRLIRPGLEGALRHPFSQGVSHHQLVAQPRKETWTESISSLKRLFGLAPAAE